MKYEKNKNYSIISAPITIKYLPDGTKAHLSLIAPSINERDCSDAWKFVARHFINESSQIQGIDFDQSYSPLEHSESFIINIDIAAMYRLTARILDVRNALKNTNFPLMKEYVSVHHPNI